MSFYFPGPSADDADAALRFVFDAWAAVPRAPVTDSADEALDLELHRAFTRWREAKELAGR